MESFRALVVEEKDGRHQASLREMGRDALPEGDVLVSVSYSSLNYKDGLAVTGKGKVIRSYPMAPGIDLAGTVIESKAAGFRAGDSVVLTGYGVGERHWGGYAQLARVKPEWLVPLPEGLDLKQAMGIGTAGFTAMLCVMALEERGLKPGGREVAVTGAAGGVGSVAVAILAKLGYRVAAFTGREETHDFLKRLGAERVEHRSALTGQGKPLETERWAGAVDTVGGDTLAGLLRATQYLGAVAACGLAGGTALNTTVLPFILRGVALLGVDSVMCPHPRRLEAWRRLAQDLPIEALDRIMQVAPLGEVPALSEQILKGQIRGRVVVDVNA
ncbi:MAG: MDR family oxidoreductase [Bryobacteraceae bacterium]